MRAALALLLLFSAATAGAAPAPSRAAVGAELLRMMACNDPAGYMRCPPPPSRIVVNALSCRPTPEADSPTRVFCRFAGIYWWPGRRTFGPICTHLDYDADLSRWIMYLYPTRQRCIDPED